MPITSPYGNGKYGFDRYSLHLGSDFTIGPVNFTGRVNRIQKVASSYTVGPVNFTGNVKRIQRIASAFTVGPVNFTGRLYPARGIQGQMTFSYSVTGNLNALWGIAGVMNFNLAMVGDIFVELYWKPIDPPSDGHWQDTSSIDGEWTPIATPAPWN